MNPKNLLGSFDAGKLIANSLSGFIVVIAVLFLFDGLTYRHLTQDLLLEASVSSLIVTSLFIAVISAIFGLIIDSLFHNLGRKLSKYFWPPLKVELDFQKQLMEDIGYESWEFGRIQSRGGEIKENVEKKYLRFTELAASTAYALLPLSVSIAIFLPREYSYCTDTMALAVAAVVILLAMVLFFTSSASLTKYESMKTSQSIDDIRQLSRSALSPKGKVNWKAPRLLWLVLFFGFMILICGVLACQSLISYSVERLDRGHILITEITNTTEDGIAPIAEVTVNIELNEENNVEPWDVSYSQIFVLNDEVMVPVNLELTNTELVEASQSHLPGIKEDKSGTDDFIPLNKPEWKVYVQLDHAQGVQEGDEIILNIYLEFKPEHSTYPKEGIWIFPVMVKSIKDIKTGKDCTDSKEYCIAYVKVNIRRG